MRKLRLILILLWWLIKTILAARMQASVLRGKGVRPARAGSS